MKCKHCGRPLDPSKPTCGYCGAKCPPVRSGKHARKQGRTEKNETLTGGFPSWLGPTACAVAVLLILAGVLSMFLGGNGGIVNDPPPVQQAQVLVSVPEDTSEGTSEGETEDSAETTEEMTLPSEHQFQSKEKWANAYYDTMLEFEEDHSSVNAERGIKYRFLYIDDDKIPELYMQAGDASALYTYAQNEVKRIYQAETAADEKLIGVRTRCGTYLSSSINEANERYSVNSLRSGIVNEEESYHTDGDECIINGASVDLVSFTQFVRAKQAAYQLADIPVYYKNDALMALETAALGKNIPEPAPEEETVSLEELTDQSAALAERAASVSSGSKRFVVYAGMYTWSQAQALCEEKGGHLAYIKSAADYEAVMDAIGKADSSLSYLWVGGKTSISDSGSVTARWNDGTATSYLDNAGLWFGSEPSGSDGDTREPYMMLWNLGDGWSFNDNSDACVSMYESGSMGYVCELD